MTTYLEPSGRDTSYDTLAIHDDGSIEVEGTIDCGGYNGYYVACISANDAGALACEVLSRLHPDKRDQLMSLRFPPEEGESSS